MIYDYKSEEIIQEVYVTCIIPIVDDIIDEYSTLHRYENISIYAPLYLARKIIANLFEDVDDLWIDEESDSMSLHKNGDVVITIAYDGMVFVEEARVDGIIKSNEGSCLTYFYDGLNSKDLSILEENAESILVFGFEEDTCEGCKSEDAEKDTELSIESDGDMHGFSVNQSDENGWSSYSFYSTDMDLVKTMAKLFE